jgi:hypothetical protein
LENENHILRAALREQRSRNKQGENIIETQNTQLVLQNMYAEKQRGALHHQERKRKRGNAEALLQTEMGRIWTDAEFREAVRKDEERVAKKQKAVGLRAKKAQWKAAEKKRIDAEHRVRHAAWEKKWDRMKRAGKRGGWGHPPAKPKRAQTPDLFCASSDEDDSGERSEDDEMFVVDDDKEETSSPESEPEFESEGDM